MSLEIAAGVMLFPLSSVGSRWILLWFALGVLLIHHHHAFHIAPRFLHSHTTTSSTTQLFVFDFFKDRSQEGFDQLGQFADKAKRGAWGEGFSGAAQYTRRTNQAWTDGLATSRARLLQQLDSIQLFSGIVGGSDGNAALLQELEDVLLQADIGAQTAQEIVEEIQSLQRKDSSLSKDDIRSILRGKLLEALETKTARAITFAPRDTANTTTTTAQPKSTIPTVIMIIGANGMGKTTTIGKLAYRLRTEGNQTVLLAACDTFRAGAVDQLQIWADRAGVDQAGPTAPNQKPSTVLFQALERGVTEAYDTILVDTSGRLSNNIGLTEELVKMKKVIQKRFSTEKDREGRPILNMDVPHETLLVLDAAQGRMALDSAKAWDASVGLTGLILTKLDGSARGGSVVAITRDLGLPIKLIGVGEGLEDLKDVRICFRAPI